MKINESKLQLINTSQYIRTEDKHFGGENTAAFFKEVAGFSNVENIIVLCLTGCNMPITYSVISTGNTDSVEVNISNLLRVILLSNASKIIIGHNHPCGILVPSESDIIHTRTIYRQCKYWDVQLVDSVIVGPCDGYESLKEYIKKNEQ